MDLGALIEEVRKHLREIHDDPSQAINEKLLEGVNRQVTGARGCLLLSSKESLN